MRKFHTIEDFWAAFCEHNTSRYDLPEQVQWLLKVAFYAGANSMWAAQGRILTEQRIGQISPKKASDALVVLQAEASAFVDKVQAELREKAQAESNGGKDGSVQ